ncbi:hypothetical protein [Iningainema tapete]|uniref:Uncharacterized protein n=1 Tax=Iningainema tapete BLCC-T55 TaxID=2748662 RepID=A0A8J6XFW3_9CYAN|nr:hypothetical protein [Iningainema tapete]MBD2772300.1 hypothetical protein [Iningainema tapete BLCC-T55]
MKTLVSHYQEIKDKLKSQLEAAQTTEQAVKIIQDEIKALADFNGDYIGGLTPPQARLATTMLKSLSQYISSLLLIKLQDFTATANLLSVGEGERSDSYNILPVTKIIQADKNLQALTTIGDRTQAFLQKVQQSRDIISSLLAGGIAGTLAGGYSWGLIGAITGGVIGKITQPSPVKTDVAQEPELPKNQVKISIDIDKLLDYLFQAFQSIDITVAGYGAREETLKPGLENNLDLLEYLQDLMADALDEQTQLPTAVRRRIEQAETILRRYGIEARVYQPSQEDLGIEPWTMFYFEPSLDPQITDYITLKHAFVKDNQVLLPGSVIEPASSDKN